MDYMMELRKLVGHRPLIMVGATMLLVNQDNEILLMKRTDNLCWGVPGGSIEPGETFEECVKRETLEETGILVDQIELFGVYSGEELHYTYPNGDEVYMFSAAYQSRITDPHVKLDITEDSEYQFFKLNQIPEEVSPPIKPILSDFISSFKETFHA